MSGTQVLTLRNVGKSYRTYASTWWRATGWITGRPTHFADNWVLRNISLDVGAGDAVGIVGRNGAGKSTLLKLIAGALTPTEGDLAVRGRVSALLELGMGFNPEFTGRENSEHVCGLLGFPRALIDRLLPSIEEFADVGAYFDQPMRTYSSGMYVRVAFAVATAMRPDILIVDEALSVGDVAFQRKSFRRIENFLAEGTTLLFVSHGLETVRAVCQRAIWLEGGRVTMTGTAKQVTEAYERATYGPAGIGAAARAPTGHGTLDPALRSSREEQQYGDRKAEIANPEIRNSMGEIVNSIPMGEDFTLSYDVIFFEECGGVHFGMMIKTTEGITVYGTHTEKSALKSEFAAGQRVRTSFALKNNLGPGYYFVNCGVSRRNKDGLSFMHRRVDVAMLHVRDAEGRDVVAGLSHLRASPSVTVLRT
ncbi:MAG: ABC transporter ATP-binding protein [Betaproteobacteria bacterium]